MKDQYYSLKAPIKMKIALIADFHELNDEDEGVLRSMDRNKPHIICIVGDILKGKQPDETSPIMEKKRKLCFFLQRLCSFAPVFLSLGNHEWMLCEEDLNILRSTGINILDNGWSLYDNCYIGGLTSGHPINYRAFRENYNFHNHTKV